MRGSDSRPDLLAIIGYLLISLVYVLMFYALD
jgi:hypothetical protein